MPIIQNIPRKQGKILVHPTQKSGIDRRVFGVRGSAGANVGDVTNPSNPPNLTAAGVDYNNQISRTGGNTNPVGNHSDTATQLYVPPLVSNGTTELVHQSKAVDVGPHERGKFFSPKPDKQAAQRVSGGVDPNSNTPFHPKTAVITRQKRYPTKPGERTSAASFGTSKHLVANPLAMSANFRSTPRWGVVKRSAAEVVLPPHKTTIGGPRGKLVGSGTTGRTSTGATIPGKVNVIGNAHSGSPFVVAWVPQARGVQPNEKGNTNPVQQNCKAGCR